MTYGAKFDMSAVAVPKQMSIRTACRLLGCETRAHLARRLGTRTGTIYYWHKTGGGMVPSIWRDRIELMLYKERQAEQEPQT